MSRTSRYLGAAVATVLVVALALAVSRSRSEDPPQVGPAPSSSPTVPVLPTPPSDPPSERTADPDTLLRDPDAAELAGPEALLAAGVSLAAGDWADLGSPAWPTTERPVYVGTATVTGRSQVATDLVIAFRASEGTDQLVLRFLPASDALTQVAGPPDVVVRRNAGAAPHELDRDGARLLVTLEPPVDAGEAVLVRVMSSYTLVPRTDVRDDGGPAGFGLLASNPSVSVLGHWLPLLTVADNDGPMIPWGDVGAFPAAVWSLQIEHGEDVVVTGGADGACPTRVGTRGCTWARGLALRDVSAVVYPPGPTVAETESQGVLVRSFGHDTLSTSAVETALAESVAGVEVFTEDFGPLAWSEFDVVAAPLSANAAGMEFPGLVIVRDDQYGDLAGGFGTYVIAHEVAHQWFHALLGNGSLSDPVVDESLAQYASVLYYAEVFGDGAARELRSRYLDGRYDRWRAGGGAEEPPGQSLAEFAGSQSYGALVYARGALAWLAAEEAVGRDRVVAFLAQVVDRYGPDSFVTDEGLVEDARAFASDLGEVLARYWFDAEPVG